MVTNYASQEMSTLLEQLQLESQHGSGMKRIAPIFLSLQVFPFTPVTARFNGK
jgi:hypothetical protein